MVFFFQQFLAFRKKQLIDANDICIYIDRMVITRQYSCITCKNPEIKKGASYLLGGSRALRHLHSQTEASSPM